MTTRIVVLEESDARDLLASVVEEALRQHFASGGKGDPGKEWLTRKEMKDLTGWSDRTLQNLRDTRQIIFSQHGRKILYQADSIMRFLEENAVIGSSMFRDRPAKQRTD